MNAKAAQSDFALLEPLGSPGSNVFRARGRDGRFVAVRLWRGHEHENALFFEAVRAARSVRHPMLSAVESCERLSDGTLCIVSEYVPGNSLDVWLSERGLPALSLVCDFVYRLCMGLHAADRQGIAHHAPYPGNLVVLEPDTRPGGRIVAKLLDVGVPPLMRPWPPGLQSAHFMAPEWLAATAHDVSHAVDARMNVYSCGCLLQYLCTGGLPFQSNSIEGLRHVHASRAEPKPLAGLLPELAAVIARALAHDPLDRQANPGELAAAIASEVPGFHVTGSQARVSLPPIPPVQPGSGRRSVPPPLPHAARGSQAPPERSGPEVPWARRSSSLHERMSTPPHAQVASAIDAPTGTDERSHRSLIARWHKLDSTQRWWLRTGVVMLVAFVAAFRLWSDQPSSAAVTVARAAAPPSSRTLLRRGAVFVPTLPSPAVQVPEDLNAHDAPNVVVPMYNEPRAAQRRPAAAPRTSATLDTSDLASPIMARAPVSAAPAPASLPPDALASAQPPQFTRLLSARSEASSSEPSAIGTRSAAALSGAISNRIEPEDLPAVPGRSARPTPRIPEAARAGESPAPTSASDRQPPSAADAAVPTRPRLLGLADDSSFEAGRLDARRQRDQVAWAETQLNKLLTVRTLQPASPVQGDPQRSEAPGLQPPAAGKVLVEKLVVHGSLTASAVRRAIERLEPDLAQCYHRHRGAGDRAHAGPVRVELVLDEMGRVRGPNVQSAGPVGLNECVGQASRRLVSVVPDTGTVSVSCTLHFKP